MEAVDAAVVRSHNAGELLLAQQRNPPFQAVEVHTCRADDVSKVPFPDANSATGLLADVLKTRKLKILAYGSPDELPDWKQDGNYEVDPPTGFWPDIMDFFMAHFKKAYGDDIQLERVWMKAGGTDKVLSGEIHMTEPYYIYENLWKDRVKKWGFEFSCVVMGYEQQFFAARKGVEVVADDDEGTCKTQLASCENEKLAKQITSREHLNAHLQGGANRKMGFLSEANFKSVHTVLSNNVEPVYYSDTSELYEAVDNGTVIAGLISGVPDATRFSVFGSELVSPRSFQMAPGPEARDLMEAADAAVVRTHNSGDLLWAQDRNPPFQALEVHTCRVDDPSKIPFPDASKATGLLADVLETRKLRILAYGSEDALPNWQQDGNYEVDPPTGFWPDYMDKFMHHFRQAYGSDIQLERVWMKAGGTEKVLDGSIHMTEPYYIYENLWKDRVKKWNFQFSCVVMGYEQQFFAKRAVVNFESAGNTCAEQLAACENKMVETSRAASLPAFAVGSSLMLPLAALREL
eukprot:gnl/TRDRNA2_/TRDRNA2_44577_c0_seq1.p1 gnl/TRDRNA2_/TRDRNA2_44577_c0~~gnl/TRDRNA2_/TRDRNA2_44577_c0_seq1.p1  ORF type:complete len:598 (-),score=140.32 gnl/TRDRNA2_/TRDRNA2_44577_c0_seq1:323-1879(-)